MANLCQTVGKLLQDILDLLATASSDTERKVLNDWKHRASRMQSKACFGSAEAQPMLRYANALLSQYTVVYDVAHATGMEHMFLTLKGRSLRNGASFTSSVPLYGATDIKAGVMTTAHQGHGHQHCQTDGQERRECNQHFHSLFR